MMDYRDYWYEQQQINYMRQQKGQMQQYNLYDLNSFGRFSNLLSLPHNNRRYYLGINPYKTDEQNKNNLILLLL